MSIFILSPNPASGERVAETLKRSGIKDEKIFKYMDKLQWCDNRDDDLKKLFEKMNATQGPKSIYVVHDIHRAGTLLYGSEGHLRTYLSEDNTIRSLSALKAEKVMLFTFQDDWMSTVPDSVPYNKASVLNFALHRFKAAANTLNEMDFSPKEADQKWKFGFAWVEGATFQARSFCENYFTLGRCENESFASLALRVTTYVTGIIPIVIGLIYLWTIYRANQATIKIGDFDENELKSFNYNNPETIKNLKFATR